MSNTAKVRPGWLVMACKEIRENLKWAMMGMAFVSLATFYQASNEYSTNLGSTHASDFWREMRTGLVLSGMLLGLGLGMLQVIPEMRRDLWAFLTHRPASRSSLFWGKVAGGLTLYSGVMFFPFLVVLCWSIIPGKLCDLPGPGLLLNVLGGILAGVPFYFAGLLTALPPARWHGSRVLAIPAALFQGVPLNVNVYHSFWLGAAVTLGASALMAMAARAAFVVLGRIDGAPSHPKAEIVANVAASLCVVALLSGGASWFAIPIFIAVVALAQRPLTVPCPSCGRKRSLGSETCPHCRSAFPGPVTDGSEIFAAPSVSASRQSFYDENLPSVQKEVTR